jgi:uncharacterized membrane protein (UPF0136 family)
MQAMRTVTSFMLAIVLSALFGVAERILQDHSATGWYLANIGAVWLAVAFAFGALAQRRSHAALIGLVAEISALAAFYGYMRIGEHHHEPLHLIAFWICCGAIAGPIFGLLGYSWRRLRSEIAGVTLAAMFVCEAILLAVGHARPRSITTLELVAGVLLAPLLLSAVRWRKNHTPYRHHH